jgi:DHA2 family multidrug resistance protein
MNYPTMTTGLVLAPRGVGTMISMLSSPRLMKHIDTRLLIAAVSPSPPGRCGE